ncbi:MAG: 2-amino-4-hydroxy-6-hydroxymethyldihydropteridine diphosphokinase [Bacillota bacterium]|nr:2-amino-4-hydroxy-6-hydroxymethyldihydropteridine diphosphokinase [Bacillota bacterium]
MKAWVAVGIPKPGGEEPLREAVARLLEGGKVRFLKASSLYETEPFGEAKGPPFLNAVLAVETMLPLRPFFQHLQRIEEEMARERLGHRVDLDLLFFEDAIIQEENLVLPYPGLLERSFLLVPLAEMAPFLPFPGGGNPWDALLHLAFQGLQRYQGPSWIEKSPP